MKKANVIELNRQADSIDDPLTEVIRNGARKLLMEAIETEVELFLGHYQNLKTQNGRQRIIRNGYMPERKIVTGIGEVPVSAPRVRDCLQKEVDQPIRFTSAILPPYLRKTKSLEELIPFLYLKGVSAGDMGEALTALVGNEAKGFSQSVVSRLKAKWKEEYDHWRKRDLSHKHYVYFWVDGIYCNVRMDDRQCILVIIGATEDGRKELIAVEGGFRESALSWRSLLLDLKSRGLSTEPKLVTGDGALGFWKAATEVFPETRCQRCWVHKTANILNKLPKSLHPKAKIQIHEIWMSDSRRNAEKSFDLFIKTYGVKYPKAVECLEKDRNHLLTFYDFPAEHWVHIRTTNPIESTFASVRLRTDKVRNCFSTQTVLNMAFKLCQSAAQKWKRLKGYGRLAEVIEGIKFFDGVSEKEIAA